MSDNAQTKSKASNQTDIDHEEQLDGVSINRKRRIREIPAKYVDEKGMDQNGVVVNQTLADKYANLILDFIRTIINMILELFGFKYRLKKSVSGRSSSGSSRQQQEALENDYNESLDQDEYDERATLQRDLTGSVKFMKAYIKEDRPSEKLKLAAKFDNPNIVSYLNYMTDDEQDHFLLTSMMYLRKHLSGVKSLPGLPAFDAHTDYSKLKREVEETEITNDHDLAPSFTPSGMRMQ